MALTVGTAKSGNISGVGGATSGNIMGTGYAQSPNISGVGTAEDGNNFGTWGQLPSGQWAAQYGAPTGVLGANQSYLPDGSIVSSAAAREAADTAAYYNDTASQLERQIGNLDSQQNVGMGNILNSFTQGANRLDQQRAVAQRDYGTQTQNNSRNYLQTRNGIMQNSRATANALQRLLGMNGAGNSSAATEQAPYAVGLQASQNLSGAQGNYATNAQSLDTNWQDTERSYGNSREDLDNQRYQQENGLRASIAQTRASLLDKIASARTQAGVARGQGYEQAAAGQSALRSQVDSLLSQITGLGNQYANPVMRTADVAYKAPDLGQYQLGQFGIGGQQRPGAASDISPTFLNLLNQRREDEQGL